MDFKNATTLRNSLQAAYNSLITLDLTEGTSERDIFIEAPILGQLGDLWAGLEYIYQLQAPFVYANSLLEEDLDVYCRNYGVGDIPATYSTGTLTFYTYTAPAADIVITSSDGGRTPDGKSYAVSGYYTLPYSDASSYYNSLQSRYEITCNIVAQQAGSIGTTGINTITEVSSVISGIEGCINSSPVTGGADAGEIQERLNLVKRTFKGRNLGPTEGIKLFVESYASKVTIVGTADSLMQRTQGLGGGIDIYIRGESIQGAVDTVTITSSGLSGNIVDVKYTSTGVTLINQPVSSIVLLLKNNVTIDKDYYQLVKDTGLLKKSTRSYDKLELTTTGLAYIGPFIANDALEIRYNYNKLLIDIENLLNLNTNAYDNRDFLLREQEYININITTLIKISQGYVFDSVTSAISLSISNFLDTFADSLLELIDIVSIIKNTTGVSNVDITVTSIDASDGRTKTASGDIPIYDNEYTKIGTVTITQWT